MRGLGLDYVPPPPPPSPNPPPPAGARGGQSAKWRGTPHGQTSVTSAAALVVHDVLAHLDNGVRNDDDATEEVRDLLPLGSLLCHMPNVRVWAGGQGGWARKNRAAGHAPIASSIECPDICRTPLGARRERRRRAIIAAAQELGRKKLPSLAGFAPQVGWLLLHPPTTSKAKACTVQ